MERKKQTARDWIIWSSLNKKNAHSDDFIFDLQATNPYDNSLTINILSKEC